MAKTKGFQTHNTVAEFITASIDRCPKTQREIAKELGYPTPNMITMFKQGLTRVPVNKVSALADALGVDRLHLFKLVMAEYAPGVLTEIESLVGERNMVTENEMEIIRAIREKTNDIDPAVYKESHKVALNVLCEKLKEQ